MAILYVARSAQIGLWASDVGLGKNVYKIGVADGDPKVLADAGWAGATDWKIVRKQEIDALTEEDALARLARKEKMIDPNFYPRLKGARGVFRLSADRVANHFIVARALAGEASPDARLKPADFATYMIQAATAGA